MGRWGILVAGVAVAVALRVAAGWSLTMGAEPLPFPDDAPYHWIRLASLAEGPVDLQEPDFGSAFPEGVRAHWPWGFDLAMWSLARLFGAAGDRTTIYRLASWVIPLLGALLLPLAGAIARRTGTPRTLAMALVAVMPFHVQYSMMGRVDHHVLEPWTLGAAVLGLLPGVSRVGAAASGLVQGLSFALFPSALYPVLVTMTIGGIPATLRRPGPTSLWAMATWAGAALSLLLSPYARDWAFFAPSRTHLVLTGLAALGVLGIAAGRRLWPAGREVRALGLGAAVAGAAGLVQLGLFPAWLASFQEGLAYLGRSGFARLSFEARPLLADPLRAWMLLGVAAPAALPGLWVLLRRTGNPPEVRESRRLVAMLALALGAGALLQRRFVMVAVPLLAIAIAEGLAALGRRAGAWLDRQRVRRSLVWALLWSALAAVLVQDARQALQLAPWQPRDQAFLEAGRLIGERARQSPVEARSGVLAPWGAGHLVRWASGLPVVCDNFFGAPEHDRGLRNCLDFLLETDEEAAARMLQRLRVRFVLIAPPHPEEVRVMASLAGLPEGSLVDDRDRFTGRFARTAWVRLGAFAQHAPPGTQGPLGASPVANVRVRDPATGEVQAEVAVLAFGEDPASGLYPPPRSEENAPVSIVGVDQ